MYKTAARHRLVHQRAFSCTKQPHDIAWHTRGRSHVQNSRAASLGTPEGVFLYKTTARHLLVHQRAFSCTKQQHGIAWYTRGRFMYKTAARHRLVHQRALHVQNGSTASLGTPEGVSLYKTAARYRLVHQEYGRSTKRMLNFITDLYAIDRSPSQPRNFGNVQNFG